MVLDNFEQLVELAPRTACVWIEHAPELMLLVTSRERLRVTGEQVQEIGPLAMPSSADDLDCAAVELFLARVRELIPDYVVAPEQRAAVAKLVTASG
jgi:predicted ATPase